MSILSELSEFIQKGQVKKVKELVNQALEEGIGPETILNEGLLDGIEKLGVRFKAGEAFIPEVLIAARAMNAGMTELKPRLVAAGKKSEGTVVVGTIKGDLHDIGKNIVKMMLEGKGLTVIDLGVDVPPENYVKAAIENNATVILCSALLTTTMAEMGEVVKQVAASPVAGKVKVMIGGAPVTQAFCDAIGADCYTDDAVSAAEAALRFCQQAKNA